MDPWVLHLQEASTSYIDIYIYINIYICIYPDHEAWTKSCRPKSCKALGKNKSHIRMTDTDEAAAIHLVQSHRETKISRSLGSCRRTNSYGWTGKNKVHIKMTDTDEAVANHLVWQRCETQIHVNGHKTHIAKLRLETFKRILVCMGRLF